MKVSPYPFSRPNPALALAKEMAKAEFLCAKQHVAFQLKNRGK